MKITKEQIVNISHPILAGTEHFSWSIGHEERHGRRCRVICMCSHVGTHIEMPFRCRYDGTDCKDFPLMQMVGEAVIINVTGKGDQDSITLADVKEAKVQDGDMIFLHTGFDRYYGSPRWTISPEALEWMLAFHPKAIGTDASGVDISGAQPSGAIHRVCAQQNVAIVYNLLFLKFHLYLSPLFSTLVI